VALHVSNADDFSQVHLRVKGIFDYLFLLVYFDGFFFANYLPWATSYKRSPWYLAQEAAAISNFSANSPD